FHVLGAVVESVTKRPFVAAMREFLHQHNLTETMVETTDLITDNRARFYRSAHEVTENIPTLAVDQLVVVEGWWASGGLMSTMPDLLWYGHMMIDAYKGRPNGKFG